MFDVIFGNPPFQKTDTRKKTPHKLWIEFTKKAVEQWLNQGGHLCWITPSSWGSPSSKILPLFRNNEVYSINLDTKEHFPDIGSSFSNYHLVRESPSGNGTAVTKDNQIFKTNFDEALMYLPNDICASSLSIHKKVMFSSKRKLDVKYDYVTCHNIIRHAFTLNQKKIDKKADSLKYCSDLKKADKLCLSIKDLITKRKTIEVTLSESRTDKYIYPLLHTNRQTWYSSVKQTFFDKRKVMWSRSGYTKPFYDGGRLGCTDMGYYILVDTDSEGENLAHNINLDLFSYIFKTAKWSGFGNEIVFTNLPEIPTDKKYTNQEMYKIFSITPNEVNYIGQILRPKTIKRIKKTKSETKSENRIKNAGEVFTPKELVLKMLEQVPADIWSDKTKTFIDPACGNGNFIVEIINKKLDSGSTPLGAIQTTYGIDIMEDNISDCHSRIIKLLHERNETFDMSKIKSVMDSNIVLNNALTNEMKNIF